MRQLSGSKDNRLPDEIIRKQAQGRLVLRAFAKLTDGQDINLDELREEVKELQQGDEVDTDNHPKRKMGKGDS